MSTLSRRTLFHYAIASGVAAVGTSLTSGLARAATSKASPAPPQIGFFGEGFVPMVARVVTGSELQFANDSSQTLRLVSAPDAPEPVHKSIAANGQTSVGFPKPGLYLLYDDATTRFDSKVGQVVARKTAPAFPRPAYAIVVVTDERGLGLKTTKSDIVIPDSTMTFTPWTVVVTAGTPIRFDNQDGDFHVAMPAPEPMLMPLTLHPQAGAASKGNLWLENMNAFAPINLPGHGGSGVLTLNQPGVHHYYCPVHAVYDPTARTFAPLSSYGGYPFIMDGVIIVLPS